LVQAAHPLLLGPASWLTPFLAVGSRNEAALHLHATTRMEALLHHRTPTWNLRQGLSFSPSLEPNWALTAAEDQGLVKFLVLAHLQGARVEVWMEGTPGAGQHWLFRP
jgi:hypothetical protein